MVEKCFGVLRMRSEEVKPYVIYTPTLRVYRKLEVQLMLELKKHNVCFSTFLNGLLIVLGVKPDLVRKFIGEPFLVHVRGPLGDCIVALRIAEVLGLGRDVMDKIRELPPCREARYEGKHSLGREG